MSPTASLAAKVSLLACCGFIYESLTFRFRLFCRRSFPMDQKLPVRRNV